MSAFIVDPTVTDSLRGYLCKNGVRAQELDDTVAEVQVRAVEALQDRRPPKDVTGWQKFLITIARNMLIDGQRETKVTEKYDVGLSDKPDDHAPFAPSGEQRDPVDARRQLAVLLHLFEAGEMPELGREILEGVADGVKMPKLARELGLPVTEVRARLKRMRRIFFKRLAALGMMVMMLALFVVAGGPGAVALRGPRPVVPVTEGGQSGQSGKGDKGMVTEPSPQELAATLRKEALRACDAGDWAECEARLDEARGLDPAGERTAEVEEARAQVEAGRRWEEERELEAKPR